MGARQSLSVLHMFSTAAVLPIIQVLTCSSQNQL